MRNYSTNSGTRPAQNRVIGLLVSVIIVLPLIGMAAPAMSAKPVTVCEKNAEAESFDGIPTTEINMVVDDSGSMFLSKSNQEIKLWSYAKYSLEVFAALMRPNDTLNVYLLSSYRKNGSAAKPVVSLSGQESKDSRVSQIRGMDLNGKGTPFEPIQDAYRDLTKSKAEEKWLVILTDGVFTTKTNEETSEEIARYIKAGNSSPDSKLQVAFLSIGEEAATISGLESNDFFVPAKAVTPADLVQKMNLFANSIFRQRSAQLDQSGTLNTDINMKRVDVFAQGPSVNIGPLNVDGVQIEPADAVEVKWSNNRVVQRGGVSYEAVPETTLQGQLVTFNDVPKGQIKFAIDDSIATPFVFKTPEVGMGIDLVRNGEVIETDFTAGSYQVMPVIVDSSCEPLVSQELGEAERLSVTFIRDGQVVGTYSPGEIVDLEKGDYDVQMAALFPQNLQVTSKTFISVKSAVTASINPIDSGAYNVSELGVFPPESAGTRFEYVIIEDGVQRQFTREEWNQIPPGELRAISTNSNIEFEAIKGSEVGQVTVVPRAPNGDVFAADTGVITFEVSSEYTANGEISGGSAAQGSVEIVDDLSTLDRFLNWWKTVGWKLLLLLLLILLILGYIFKKRFSKKVKKRPSITGTPNQVGTSAEESTGKFRKTGLRTYLPFVADTATLSYVPAGVSGFRAMKLKAGQGKSMIVTNWKQIADKNNTEINGTPINEDTRRAPQFGPSATITATTPQMTYEMTPNS